MELTIDQALQQGVAKHKEGKLQDAEGLYRAILHSQPLHPDANHNLGVLAVSVNKAEAALPLFKTALEANPNIEQFWLSYIDALIKNLQFDNAKQVVEQAKRQGVAKEKLNVLMTQLASINMQENISRLSPPQQQLSNLLAHYQDGQFIDAEKLAISMTQDFPQHPFGWKVLGAVLGQTGRRSEAVYVNRTSVLLYPHDAATQYNLGTSIQGLGRPDEAEAIFRQALMLKPDLAEAHNNLGTTIKEVGRLEEAKVVFRQALLLKPNLAEAYSNLGATLHELDSLVEAAANYSKAKTVKPELLEAHNNLLGCLYQLDKKSPFFAELDYLINQDEANAVIGSLVCRSELKYGMQRPNPFCTEPLKYVLHTDLNTKYDFEEIFVERAKTILNDNRVSNKKQTLLVNGHQTSGNLFETKNEFTDKIQEIIRLEIEKYRIHFKNNNDGLIKKWPTEYSLYGWLISMKSGGELKPHIHDQGWLSGSIYINIPPKLKVDSGNLVVSLGEDRDATGSRINMKKIISVVTGSLVLFPASLTHYTIPFESEEERIVLAFDVKK